MSTHWAAENRAAVTPDTRPRPPAFQQDECRRSERPGQLGAEAHRGDHPPAVRRRGAPLTQRQRRRRQGKKNLPVKPVNEENLNVRPGRVRVGSVLKYRVHKTSEATEVRWTNQCSVCSRAVTGGSSWGDTFESPPQSPLRQSGNKKNPAHLSGSTEWTS